MSLNIKIKRLVDALFTDENNCIICGTELRGDRRYRMCPFCTTKLEYTHEKVCLKCGKPIKTEGEYCNNCQNGEIFFDRAFAPVVYAGEVPTLVMNYKFHNKRYYHKSFSAFMADKFLDEQPKTDVIIPVPLHKNRQKERGYNQSEYLAEDLSKRFNIPLDTKTLVRVKETKVQSILAGKERRANISGAFALSDKKKITGKDVLLIDDVLTTGSTTSECAKVLKKAGAKSVTVLTFATVPLKPPIDNAEESKISRF